VPSPAPDPVPKTVLKGIRHDNYDGS
jgi:hypothetical protein